MPKHRRQHYRPVRWCATVLIVACLAAAVVGADDSKSRNGTQDANQFQAWKNAYTFDPPDPGFVSQPVTTDFSQLCNDHMKVARRLFKFAVCHTTNDQIGRRKRRPSPNCPFAIVGYRAAIVLDVVAHNIEEAMGLPDNSLDELKIISNQFRSVFHQSFVYGSDEGHMDYSSGFFCGEGVASGRQWGYLCQDDARLVDMYLPMDNNTMAIDNWFPRQYHLTGRKFDCDRLWRAENAMSIKFDACANPDTAVDYSAVMRNCHMYINEVVDLYDAMMEVEGKAPIDLMWNKDEVATLKNMKGYSDDTPTRGMKGFVEPDGAGPKQESQLHKDEGEHIAMLQDHIQDTIKMGQTIHNEVVDAEQTPRPPTAQHPDRKANGMSETKVGNGRTANHASAQATLRKDVLAAVEDKDADEDFIGGGLEH